MQAAKTSKLSRPGSTETSARPVLRMVGVQLRYEHHVALDDINCTIQAGERVAVVGPNGAGKSTLFKLIAGILKPTAGELFIDKPSGAKLEIAYIPQRSQIDWQFPVTVADVVMMGRTAKLGMLRWPSAHDRQIVAQALEMVRLSHLARHQISQLSGGQQQRMFIARALAQESTLMLMDEPLTGLDIPSQDDVFHLLDMLRQRGVTVFVALHDLHLAAERFDKVMLLNRQMIGYGPASEVFTPQRLLSAYGGHLHLILTGDGSLAVADTHCDEGAPYRA